MLQTAISKPLLRKAAAELQKELPFSIFKHLIEKGRNLSRFGLVYNVVVKDEHHVEGEVADQTVHRVAFDLTDIVRRHRCPCGTESLCPHVLALFFYVYGNVFDSGELFQRWKQGESKQPRQRQTRIEMPTLPPAEPAESVDQWRNCFTETYAEFEASIRSHDNWPYRSAHHLFPSLAKGGPKSVVARPLYRFHAALFLLERLFEYGKERGWHQGIFGSYGQFSWRQDINYIADELFKLLERFPSERRTPQLEQLIEQTIPYVRELLQTTEMFALLIYDLYTAAWEVLFTKEEWRRQEKEQLLHLTRQERLPLAFLAAAHLAFLLEDDEEALALYRGFPSGAVPLFVEWMERFITDDRPARFESFWAHGKQELPHYLSALPESERSKFANEVCRLYESYAKRRNKLDEYEELLKQCMPYSANRYVFFLYQQGLYRQMIDLYLLADVTAHEMYPQFLKTLEKRDPSLVLPLYHRAVMRFVRAKNRESYRMAVHYLKKLRACYRSMKQMTQWEAYIEQLSARTVRMRAFHEELRKGKMLP